MILGNPSMMYEIPTEDGQPSSQQPIYVMPPPVQNQLSRINPFYTKQQTDNSLLPMQMFNQYRQTGVIPNNPQGFTPYTMPEQTATPAPSGTAATSAPLMVGGK